MEFAVWKNSCNDTSQKKFSPSYVSICHMLQCREKLVSAVKFNTKLKTSHPSESNFIAFYDREIYILFR